MQHRPVADVAVLLDHRVGARKAVHHAGVLHVHARSRISRPKSPRRLAQGPIAVGADDHVADQHREGWT
jgi:hypothetical protein